MGKYTSPNSGQPCTAAQLFAELMCTRQASKDRVDLPFKFWNTERWKKKFKTELFKALALLKLYPEDVVLRTIESNPWLLTLLYKNIAELLDKEQRYFDDIKKKAESAQTFENVDVNNAQKKFVQNTGKLDRLRKLDE